MAIHFDSSWRCWRYVLIFVVVYELTLHAMHFVFKQAGACSSLKCPRCAASSFQVSQEWWRQYSGEVDGTSTKAVSDDDDDDDDTEHRAPSAVFSVEFRSLGGTWGL